MLNSHEDEAEIQRLLVGWTTAYLEAVGNPNAVYEDAKRALGGVEAGHWCNLSRQQQEAARRFIACWRPQANRPTGSALGWYGWYRHPAGHSAGGLTLRDPFCLIFEGRVWAPARVDTTVISRWIWVSRVNYSNYSSVTDWITARLGAL